MLNLLEWIVVLALVFLGVPRMLLRGSQKMVHPGTRVDVTRRFSMAEYRMIMNRAGWRCEHHGMLTGRCHETTDLEADHIHPHSRGGQTGIANAQALCHRHNTAKGSKTPFWWNLLALERRRAEYFSERADRKVVRYGSISATRPKQRKRSTTRRRRRRRRRWV